MPFGIDRARLSEITVRHADALEAAERTIATALTMDGSISPDEMMATVKWISAVRFATIVATEARSLNGADFEALIDAVCEASE